MVGSLSKGTVTDAQIVQVLRPFVHGTTPILGALRESNPFGLRQHVPNTSSGGAAGDTRRGVLAGARNRTLDWVAARKLPGTRAWAGMDIGTRTTWWVNRVGRFTAFLAAVPGIGGVLADRLPVQDALGAAGQGLLLCALAGEHGIRDEDTQIRLLASVMFDRNVDTTLGPRALGPRAERPRATPGPDQPSAELTAELGESQRRHGRFTPQAIARTVWRMGRLLRGLGDELGKRPQGRWYHKLIGLLPLVGMAGDYLGERAALRRVARAGRHWIARHQAVRY